MKVCTKKIVDKIYIWISVFVMNPGMYDYTCIKI